jgi:coenzyme Q-binding protein COQ10
MPRTNVTRRVPYPWQKLYALVLDVESYPHFVPFCRKMVVLNRSSSGGMDQLLAQMEVGFGVLRESYTSRILGDPATREINIASDDGPFRHLKGHWSFKPVNHEATEVHFEVEYAFRNPVVALAVGKVFNTVFNEFVRAFEKRATDIFV